MAFRVQLNPDGSIAVFNPSTNAFLCEIPSPQLPPQKQRVRLITKPLKTSIKNKNNYYPRKLRHRNVRNYKDTDSVSSSCSSSLALTSETSASSVSTLYGPVARIASLKEDDYVSDSEPDNDCLDDTDFMRMLNLVQTTLLCSGPQRQDQNNQDQGEKELGSNNPDGSPSSVLQNNNGKLGHTFPLRAIAKQSLGVKKVLLRRKIKGMLDKLDFSSPLAQLILKQDLLQTHSTTANGTASTAAASAVVATVLAKYDKYCGTTGFSFRSHGKREPYVPVTYRRATKPEGPAHRFHFTRKQWREEQAKIKTGLNSFSRLMLSWCNKPVEVRVQKLSESDINSYLEKKDPIATKEKVRQKKNGSPTWEDWASASNAAVVFNTNNNNGVSLLTMDNKTNSPSLKKMHTSSPTKSISSPSIKASSKLGNNDFQQQQDHLQRFPILPPNEQLSSQVSAIIDKQGENSSSSSTFMSAISNGISSFFSSILAATSPLAKRDRNQDNNNNNHHHSTTTNTISPTSSTSTNGNGLHRATGGSPNSTPKDDQSKNRRITSDKNGAEDVSSIRSGSSCSPPKSANGGPPAKRFRHDHTFETNLSSNGPLLSALVRSSPTNNNNGNLGKLQGQFQVQGAENQKSPLGLSPPQKKQTNGSSLGFFGGPGSSQGSGGLEASKKSNLVVVSASSRLDPTRRETVIVTQRGVPSSSSSPSSFMLPAIDEDEDEDDDEEDDEDNEVTVLETIPARKIMTGHFSPRNLFPSVSQTKKRKKKKVFHQEEASLLADKNGSSKSPMKESNNNHHLAAVQYQHRLNSPTKNNGGSSSPGANRNKSSPSVILRRTSTNSTATSSSSGSSLNSFALATPPNNNNNKQSPSVTLRRTPSSSAVSLPAKAASSASPSRNKSNVNGQLLASVVQLGRTPTTTSKATATSSSPLTGSPVKPSKDRDRDKVVNLRKTFSSPGLSFKGDKLKEDFKIPSVILRRSFSSSSSTSTHSSSNSSSSASSGGNSLPKTAKMSSRTSRSSPQTAASPGGSLSFSSDRYPLRNGNFKPGRQGCYYYKMAANNKNGAAGDASGNQKCYWSSSETCEVGLDDVLLSIRRKHKKWFVLGTNVSATLPLQTVRKLKQLQQKKNSLTRKINSNSISIRRFE